MPDPTTDAAREAFTEAEIVANHGNPTWEAIWGVIKKWDISRDGFTLYANANGDDVQRIFLAVAAVSRARDEAWREAVEAVLGGVGENASERFDYSAHLCMEATGVLPPGKDDPFPTLTDEQRLEVWRTFARTRRVILSALLARMDGAK